VLPVGWGAADNLLVGLLDGGISQVARHVGVDKVAVVVIVVIEKVLVLGERCNGWARYL